MKQSSNWCLQLSSTIPWTTLASSCLSVTSCSDIEKQGSHHPPSRYLGVQFQYTSIAASELLTHTLMGNNFINRVQCLRTVPCAVILCNVPPWVYLICFSLLGKSYMFLERMPQNAVISYQDMWHQHDITNDIDLDHLVKVVFAMLISWGYYFSFSILILWKWITKSSPPSEWVEGLSTS